jgi:two-component system, NarL family, response regulator NreC
MPTNVQPRSLPSSQPIRVVLADDHNVVRRTLRLLLERERDVEVVAEAGDVFTTVRHVAGHMPHVLLLDLRSPNGSSIDLIRRLRAQAPDTEIVVVTMEDSPAFARAAIDLGAIGYVLKDSADSELPQAVRCAARGERFVSPRVAARLDALSRAVDGDGLSPRETEVLRLIALGFTSAEIADELCLSRRTVESHRTQIHRKLGLSRRSELVRYALDLDLIGLPADAASLTATGQMASPGNRRPKRSTSPGTLSGSISSS